MNASNAKENPFSGINDHVALLVEKRDREILNLIDSYDSFVRLRITQLADAARWFKDDSSTNEPEHINITSSIFVMEWSTLFSVPIKDLRPVEATLGVVMRNERGNVVTRKVSDVLKSGLSAYRKTLTKAHFSIDFRRIDENVKISVDTETASEGDFTKVLNDAAEKFLVERINHP